MATALALEHVAREFVARDRIVHALESIDLAVAEGELATIVGPSGCGKSTMLNLMAGLLRPTRGTVRFHGEEVSGPSGRIGYVTQKDTLLPWRTLLENVVFILELQGVAPTDREQRAHELLKHVGLTGFEDAYPHELSGGMRQRAMIVRALAPDPEVLLLDEPFGALDAQTRAQLQNQLLDLHAETGKTMIFITHDLIEAVALGDRVIVISRPPGRVRAIHDVRIRRPRNVFEIHREPGFNETFELVQAEILEEMTSDVNAKSVGSGLRPAEKSWNGNDRSGRWPYRLVVSHTVFMLAVLALWQGASGTIIEPFWISRPTDIAVALYEWLISSEFWRHLRITVVEMLVGFGIGAGFGFVGAVVMSEWRRVGDFLDPYMAALYGIPKVALAPLFILWFGIGLGSKIAMAAVLVLFLVLFNSNAGMRSVDVDLIRLGYASNATRWQILRKIKLPYAAPYILTGLKLSLPIALIGAIVAEYISANQGVGYLLVRAAAFFDTARTFAGIIILAGVVMIGNALLGMIERHVLRWRPRLETEVKL